MWIWQRPDWPNFTYDAGRFSAVLTDYRRRAERLAGDLTRLALDDQQEALVDLLVSEAIKTSAIEGELLTSFGGTCGWTGLPTSCDRVWRLWKADESVAQLVRQSSEVH